MASTWEAEPKNVAPSGSASPLLICPRRRGATEASAGWGRGRAGRGLASGEAEARRVASLTGWRHRLSYGHPWAHYSGGYQDRLLGGPLGLPALCYTTPDGVERKDYGGGVLG
jgi:hypothetical protein